MKFILINATSQLCWAEDARDLHAAERMVDLDPGKTDHGVCHNGHGIVVYEFGLFVPKERQRYFSVNGRLYAGNAVVYGFNWLGESIDADPEFEKHAGLTFYRDWTSVDQAIELGQVIRPQIAVNSVVSWKWPAPAPAGMMR